MPRKRLVFGTLLCIAASRADAQNAHLIATPARPQPGALVRLALVVPRNDSVVDATGTLAGEPLHFRRADSVWRAVGGIPVDAERRVTVNAFVRRATGAVDTVRLAIPVPPPPPRRTEPLKVDTSFSQKPDSALEARIARENEIARDVGRRAHETPPLWSTAFLRPRQTRVTSSFGSGRVFNGAVTSRHLGVDFAGNVGEPVRAANRGVLALVDTFFLAGSVIYVDHGGGLVTGYFHLSKQLVSVGDTVARGQVIGLVGSTGRVTGPHLHWSARYGAVTVNPSDLLSLRSTWFGARK